MYSKPVLLFIFVLVFITLGLLSLISVVTKVSFMEKW